MIGLSNLPSHGEDGALTAIIETPRGSRVKLAYDETLGAFVLRRALALGVSYPFDWGFIPSTRAPDGDPLDVMVYHDCPTYPGVVIACRPIGVVEVTQKKHGKSGRERNDRLIAVPVREARYDDARRLDKRVRIEIEQFFLSAVLFEDKGVKLEGWGGPKAARRLVTTAERAYDKGKKKD